MFTAVIGRIGATELIIVLVIVLIIFGPKHLPQLSKSLGKTISNFKKGMEDETEEKSKTETAQAQAAPVAQAQEVKAAAPENTDTENKNV